MNHAAPITFPLSSRRQRAGILVGCLILALLTGLACKPGGSPATGPVGEVTVRLRNGAQVQEFRPGVPAGSTVMAVLEVLRNDGKIQMRVEGDGTSALLTELAGVVSSRGDGPVWLYGINGNLANVGAGTQTVQPGDTIDWCYLRWDERAQCFPGAAPVNAHRPDS